jgi:hypothetical protein
MRKSPKVEDLFTVDAADLKEAKADALTKAKKKWERLGIYLPKEIEVVSAETIREPKDKTTAAKVREAGETSLEIISGTTEVTTMIAKFQKLQKVVSKLEKAGKIMTGIDLMNDFAKVIEYLVKLNKAKDQRVKDDYAIEIYKLIGKMTKTVVVEVTGTGLIDLGFSIIGKVYSGISQAKVDKENQAKKDEYDDQKYALYDHEAWYEVEWRMYVNGISMADIISLRETQWLRYWDPTGVKKLKFDPAKDTQVYHDLKKIKYRARGTPKFPNPSGIYVSHHIGIALDFVSKDKVYNGKVYVRPNIEGKVDKAKFIGEGKWVWEKNIHGTVKDAIYITFGEVSWKNSMYNKQPSDSQYFGYSNVDKMYNTAKDCKLIVHSETELWEQKKGGSNWEKLPADAIWNPEVGWYTPAKGAAKPKPTPKPAAKPKPTPKPAPKPTVTKVTVTPAAVTIGRGTTKQFRASVTGTNSPAKTVKWSLTGASTGTKISADGLLKIGANQSPGTITVKATSTADSSKSGKAAVKMPAPAKPAVKPKPAPKPSPKPKPAPKPTVTKVTVTPAVATIGRGATRQFRASVTGTNSPAKTVKWSLTGASTGTKISADGLLTVGANQTSGTITVKAASTASPSKSGKAAVKVPAPAKPAVKPKPAPKPAPKPKPTPKPKTTVILVVFPTADSVKQGSTKQYRAYNYVGGKKPATVNWSVSGANGGTSISSSGLLTVGANQSPGAITVKATSTADSSKSKAVKVKVLASTPAKPTVKPKPVVKPTPNPKPKPTPTPKPTPKQSLTLDGVWVGKSGGLLTIKGSTGVDTKLGSDAWIQEAIRNGYFKAGQTGLRNLTRTGDRTWGGQRLVLNVMNRGVKRGTSWSDITIFMSADGKSIEWDYGFQFSKRTETFTRQK